VYKILEGLIQELQLLENNGLRYGKRAIPKDCLSCYVDFSSLCGKAVFVSEVEEMSRK